MIIKPIDRKDDFQDLVKVLLYWEYFPVLTGRHTKTLRCSAAPRLAAHITVGSGHSDIYTYLHISTHIYSYLLIPDICTYLLFSTHVYISVLLYSPLLLGSILMLILHSISKIQSNFPAMLIPSCHWSVHPQVFASKLPFWLMYQYWNITTHQLRNKS